MHLYTRVIRSQVHTPKVSFPPPFGMMRGAKANEARVVATVALPNGCCWYSLGRLGFQPRVVCQYIAGMA
jgi:hypothetical protein